MKFLASLLAAFALFVPTTSQAAPPKVDGAYMLDISVFHMGFLLNSVEKIDDRVRIWVGTSIPIQSRIFYTRVDFDCKTFDAVISKGEAYDGNGKQMYSKEMNVIMPPPKPGSIMYVTASFACKKPSEWALAFIPSERFAKLIAEHWIEAQKATT